MNKITVLMSSYNGDGYLREQLDSIFAQANVDVNVVVRNDGSTNPNTEQILKEYSEKYSLSYYTGKNLGAARSFYDLVIHAPKSQFYAFADQDDYWMPDKLSTGISKLTNEDATIPLLYFCNYNLSNADGEIIQPAIKKDAIITKGNALIESFAPGCSMVFNDKLLHLVQQHIPQENLIHDRWFFLTAVFFGKVIYDDNPHFNYRQHSGNVIGAMTLEKKEKDLARINKDSKFPLSYVTKLFYSSFQKELSDKEKKLILNCINYKTDINSLATLLFSSSYRLAFGTWKRRLYWKFRLLLKKL